MPARSRCRALLRAAAAASLALAGLTTVAPSASAAPADTVRVDGGDTFDGGTRYDTAADAATRAYPDGADTVVIATGQKFPDALAANGIAGANDAPILIVQQDAIPAATDAALTTLDPTNLVLVGGDAAISADVEAEFTNDGFNVTREFGENRFETAEVVAETIGTAPAIDAGGGAGALSTVVLANGLVNNGVDSIAVSPALHNQDIPLLLTGADSLQANAASAIDTLAPDQVIIVGGVGVVSQDIEDGLEADGKNVVRLSGDTRFTTATAIADFEINQLGMAATNTHLAFGFKFPDALVGGPLASQQNGPILLTSSLPQDTEDWIVANAEAIETIFALGGTAVIDDAILTAAAQAANPTNQFFTVTPGEEATNEVSSSAFDDTGRHQYTATGLTAGEQYDLALVPAEHVTDLAGTVTFADEDEDGAADDLGGTDAEIELVNGSPTDDEDHQTGTADGDGTLTFTADSTVVEAVVSVVFDDTDDDADLDVDTAGTPTEDFAIGGQKNWVPAEADDGAATVTVAGVNRSEDYFVATGATMDPATYFFDADDLFGADSAEISMAEFEGLLTPGDVVEVDYDPDEADESTFDVTTDAIPDISTPEAEGSDLDGDGDRTDVTLSWTASTQPDAVHDVYRDDGVTGGTLDGGDTLLVEDTTATSHELLDEPETTHDYIVDVSGGTSGEHDTDGPFFSNDVTLPADDTTAAQVFTEGAAVDVNDTFDVADRDDEWLLHFTEDVEVAADAVLAVSDSGGSPVMVENGVNATWAVTDDVVTVTIDETLDDGSGTMDYPLTIAGLSGVTDTAGNESDLDDVADLTIEEDGPELYTDTATTGDTTFTVTFNEELDATSAEDETNYRYDDGNGLPETPTSATLATDGRTVTLDVATAVDDGATVDPTGVEDTDGQASDQGAATVN